MAENLRLHPGAATALRALRMTETDVARAIAAGELSSPQRFMNLWLYAIRLTGTGVAYRQALKEFVYRAPEHYVDLARWQGVPVVFSHPKGMALDTGEFRDRVIGAVMFAYRAPDGETWGVARINDDDAGRIMDRHKLSTSPAVVFKPADGNRKVGLEDGSTLLIEGQPSLLDHVAICEEGVWDKGREPSGVDSTNTQENTDMAASADKKDDDARRADEADAGQKLDKLLSAMDNVARRMDAIEEEHAAVRDRKDMKRDDGEIPEELREKLDDDAANRKDDDEGEPEYLSSMPEETAADKSRKDAARGFFKGRRDVYRKRRADAAKRDDRKDAAKKDGYDDAAKKDGRADNDDELPADLKDALDDDARKRADEEGAEPPAELMEKAGDKKADAARAHFKARHDSYRRVRADAMKPLSDRIDALAKRMPAILSDADRDAMADAQARADSVYSMFGKRAPRPLDGETVVDYRRRLAKEVQPHSPTWKEVHLASLGADAFNIAENTIYADAQVAAASPDFDGGALREQITVDATGRRISTFHGHPASWMAAFGQSNRRVVAGFDKNPL